MGVMITTKFPGGMASNLETVAKEHADLLVKVSEEGRAKGAIHHCFVEEPDGSVLVIDEWESEEAYLDFFQNQADIAKIAEAAGVTGPPTHTTYRIIDTADRF
jgi:heme-degrading monooxygenase HmoA